MTRILISGRNCDLSRDTFARAARLAYAPSPLPRRAVSYSGMTPVSVAGGTRSSSERDRGSCSSEFQLCTDPEPPQPYRLGVAQQDDSWPIYVMLAAAMVAACLGILGASL